MTVFPSTAACSPGAVDNDLAVHNRLWTRLAN
jgi:hypothetical protein